MRDKLTGVAVRTSLFYAFFALVWVLVSGAALITFVRDPFTIEKIQICKACAFVVVTAFLLYGILRRQMRWLKKEIEAREEAEQLTCESQERFATIFRSSPVGITLSRAKDRRLVDTNPAFLSMVGYSRDEVIGRTSREAEVWASPEEQEGLVDVVRTRGRLESVELPFRKKSGEIGTMLGSGELIRIAGEDHLLGMSLDITERKRAEEGCKAAEELYHAIFEYAFGGSAIVEEDGTISHVNKQLCEALGRSREEMEGSNWTILVSPGDLERLEGYRSARMRDAEAAPLQFECRAARKDGASVDVLLRVGMIPGTKRAIYSGMDITELRQAQEALRESESRFRSAFEAAAIGMAIVGLDGRWLKVNQALCVSLGYSEEELLSKTFRDITYPDDLENDLEHRKRLIDDEIPYYHIEKRYFHRDGYIVWVLLCVSIVRDARGYPLYFVSQMEDITERKFLEEKLQTALITDELTGIYNRKGFFDLAGDRLKSASERRESCTLFLVKLEDMKLINDTLGQKEGDAIITSVARMLQESFRESVVGRIGGVEFAVLVSALKGTADGLAAQLKCTVAKIENPDAGECPVSASVGFARCLPETPYFLEQLIAQVDEAMFREKQRKQC